MSRDCPFTSQSASSFASFSSSVSPGSRKSTALNCDDPPAKPLSILIAEDDPVSRLFLARVLNKLGHAVQSVKDGQKVLELLTSKERFDLLLTDIQMPHVNGIELSRILRSDSRYSHHADMAIIAITAYGTAEDRTTYLKVGIDDFLPKPIDGQLLQFMLARLTSAPQ